MATPHEQESPRVNGGFQETPRVSVPIEPGTMSADQPVDADPASYTPGLNLLRRRRQYFFGVVLVYVPVMWLLHEFAPRFMLKAFAVWVVMLVAAMAVSAVARCPRCGNCFHMHGMTLLYLRKCLHCQLHINADRQK